MQKVRYGVIGTAGIAWKSTLPGMLQAKNCEVVAIAGRDPEKLERYQKEFSIPKGYLNYADILSDPQIDAVYIPLANQLHKYWCIEAARHGKHILCEKPLAPTKRDLEEILEVCAQEHVKIMEAFPYVHGPLFGRVKELVTSGKLGKILNIQGDFIAPKHPATNVRMRRETLGGSIYDLGCYNTSLCIELYGRAPLNVTACANLTEERIDDYACILMDFGDNQKAVSVSAMRLAPMNRRLRFCVFGEKGSVEVPDFAYNISGEIPVNIRIGGESWTERIASPDNYMLEVEQFGRCILEGEPYRFSHQESLDNAALLEKALSDIGYY